MVAPTPTTPTAQAGSYSQPNLHFASPPRASISSVASLPAHAGSGAGLSRSSSASAAAPGAVNPSRRKPVPSHLPAMTEVAPLPLSVASAPPASAPASAGGGAPFAAQQQRQARGGAQEVQGAIADGGAGADVRPRKEKEKERELVPLLGVPEGRVAGHEAHYVTTTTKARWDGAPSRIFRRVCSFADWTQVPCPKLPMRSRTSTWIRDGVLRIFLRWCRHDFDHDLSPPLGSVFAFARSQARPISSTHAIASHTSHFCFAVVLSLPVPAYLEICILLSPVYFLRARSVVRIMDIVQTDKDYII